MWLVLAFKLAAISFAALASVRAKFLLGLGAVAAIIYCTLVRVLSLIPPHLNLPLSGILASGWWVYPVCMVVISTSATVVAFRNSNRESPTSPKKEQIEKSAFAFLGNMLLDVALLTIFGIAQLAVAADDF